MAAATGFASRSDSRRPAVLTGLGGSPLLMMATGGVVLLALVMGGGTTQGLWSDAAVEVAALALLGTVFLTTRQAPAQGERFAVAIVAAIVLLPVLQLVPLPPAVWTILPGRAAIAAAYGEAAIAMPWLPVSLDPGATMRSALSLIPAAAVFFSTLSLGATARRTLTLVVTAVALASVVLGLAQVAQGPGSALRLYPITNASSNVGFFANVNHEAALLYAVIPLTGAWMVGLLHDPRRQRAAALIVGMLALAAFLLGLAMALSRAGILLALGALAASLAIAARNDERVGKRAVLVIGVGIVAGALLASQFAQFKVVDQFGDNPLNDLRVTMAGTTLVAGTAVQPLGSGFGTFVDVYQMHEPAAELTRSYVNHAHDDWLEAWLEGGWPAVAVAVAFLIWFAAAAWRAWRQASPRGRMVDRALAQGASIAILLLLLHSAVDYPLRTTAMSTVFALCCALLIPPRRSEGGERTDGSPRHASGKPRTRGGWQAEPAGSLLRHSVAGREAGAR